MRKYLLTAFIQFFAFSISVAAPPVNPSPGAVTPGNAQVGLAWTNPGTFTEVMIVASSANITLSPSGDGSAYTGNPAFGSGTVIVPGVEYVVYEGTGTSTTITGLTNGVQYKFKIWARGGSGSEWSVGGASFSDATPVPNPVTSFSFTASCSENGTASWSNPTPANTILVFAKAVSAITVSAPTADVSTYTANPVFGSGTVYEEDLAAYCVYKGTGTSVNVTGLTAGVDYYLVAYSVGASTYSTPKTDNDQAPAQANVTGFNSTPSDQVIDLGWTNPGSCFDEVLIIAGTAAITATPSGDGSAYTANPGFGSGTEIVTDEFVVYKGTGTSETVTGLTNGTTYYFKAFTRKGLNWSSGSSINDTPVDNVPPTILSVSPVDGSTNVATDISLVITFDEPVAISATSASGTEDDVRIKENLVTTQTIPRGSGSINIVGNVVTVTLSALNNGLPHNARVGNKVFSDLSGNDFAGVNLDTDWEFSTSPGVTVTTGSVAAGTSVFSTLSPITLTENGTNDFRAGASKTLKLAFNGSGYIFDASSPPTLSFGGGANNITSATVSAIDFTSMQITYTVVGTSAMDVLTISGIKVRTSNTSNPSVDIVRVAGSSDGTIAGAPLTTVLGTVTSCATAAPSLSFSGGDDKLCLNETLAGLSVQATGAGSIRWYTDASLTTLIGALNGNMNPSAAALGFTNTPAGTQTRYATLISGCESGPAAITLTVNPLPGADAGADQTVANGNTEICSAAQVILGGAPTLQVPSAPGAYTYTWSSVPAMAISSVPNPTVTLNNPGISNSTFTFTITITDANLCQGTDSKVVDVKPAIAPTLSQPNSTTFSTNTAPLLLAANPPGGVFSGIGVVQTGASTYKFSAENAYDNTQPLPQNYPLYYTVTSAGCTITNYPIATMTLSNQLFSTLATEYCASENPTFNDNGASPPAIRLSADVNAYNNMVSNVNNWNSSSRFSYAPLNTYYDWLGFLNYGVGATVRYLGEAYICNIANTGVVPAGNPAFWARNDIMKMAFNGTIRNYYEGFYGGNTGPSTIQKESGTYTVSSQTYNYYQMLTNTNYVNCPGCDYNYPAFYMEFLNANDMQYIIPWNSNYYYYPNDVVFYAGNYYKCILTYASNPYYSYNQQPNAYPGVWQNVGTNFDAGYQYRQGSSAGMFVTGQYVAVHKNPVVSFTGLTSGLVNPTEFCSSNTDYVLTGSNSPSGSFDMSYDNSIFSTYTGLISGAPTPGSATFNSLSAYTSSTSGGTIRPFYVRYTFDPGTNGSTGQACVGTSTQLINVNLAPTVSFIGTTPPTNQYFCFNGAPANIQTSTTSSTSASVALSGFGVADLTGGIGTFDPNTALTQLIATTGLTYTYVTRPSTNIIATATDLNGCTGQATRTVIVNPVPPASVASYPTNLCYTGTTINLDGQQVNAYYEIVYKDVVTPHTEVIGTTASPSPDISFDPASYFDDAVNNYGANPLATLSYDVIYTAYDPDLCLNPITPVNIKVAPRIPVTIAGVNPGEEFCSNLTPVRQITLSPTGGNLTITRNAVPVTPPTIVNGQFPFDFIPLAGGDYVFNYDVITGNNCSNPATVSVKVLPSPVASFTAPPKCNGDVIPFNADGSQNVNATPTYTWTFEGQQVIGQNTTYQFSSVGTYTVNLLVDYPPAGTTNTVCTSTLSLDQYVGLIPVVDFNVSNVCDGDLTTFNSVSAITPISQAQWDFGDGNSIPFGTVNQPVTGNPSTSGTYGDPIHGYATPASYTVTLTGRTSALTGSCTNSKTREVSILQYLKTYNPANPYSMKSLNGENGFWVAEDRRTNSTWEFGNPNKPTIVSADKTWVTSVSDPYKSGDQSYVNSPCLDLSAYTKPSISIHYRYDTDPGKDGAVLQYSTNGGATWIRLGTPDSGLDWYNEQGISSSPGGQNLFGWSGTNQKDWQVGKHALNSLVGQNKVRFRIAFASDDKDTLDGFAFNDVKIEERNRFTLTESFTNEDPQISTEANANANAFQSIPESEVVKIEYHVAFPGPDNIHDLNRSDFNSRASFYGLTNSLSTVPRGYIDGISNGPFNSTWAASYLPLRSLVSAPLSIMVENPASSEPDEIIAKVSLTALENIPAGKFDLIIGIVEKNVGSNKFVMRKLLPNAAGTRLVTPLNKSDVVTITEKWSVDNITNISELAIIAFVQDQSTQNVLQAGKLDALTNPPIQITGLGDEELTKAITLFPNPANKEFTIQLPAPAKQPVELKMVDPVGKVVHDSFIREGANKKTVATQELSPGIYIMLIETAEGEIARKKVLVVHDK